MRPKTFQLLERCVEYGVGRGYTRAHKHTDSPTEDQIKEQIQSCIMDEICEWFDFDEGIFNGSENKSW